MAGPKGTRGPINKETLKVLPRMLKYLLKHYKLPLFFVLICVIFASIAGSFNSYFLKTVIDKVITPGLSLGFDAVKDELNSIIILIICVFGVGLIANLV